MHFILTIFCTIGLEMVPSDFPVVFVAESNGYIKQVILKWDLKSHQLLSIRITQKNLRASFCYSLAPQQVAV